MSEWISVKDRLPIEEIDVLAFAGECQVVLYRAGRWLYDDAWFAHDEPITHWMPLPEPPKEKS